MPLRNRADPHGQLHAVQARGCFMGNRGVLHNDNREIIRNWKLQRWITCALVHGDVKRTLMTPGAYTELFFLDEPTSYAAGHRPCSMCRNSQYKLFKAAWAEAFPNSPQTSGSIDSELHEARVQEDGRQRVWQRKISELPDGTLVEHLGVTVLLWGRKQWRWSFTVYDLISAPIQKYQVVDILTPDPIVRLFAAGLHESLLVHSTALNHA